MTTDALIHNVGSYADWEPWRVVRYNLFELKEHLIRLALRGKDGLLTDDAWEEMGEEDTPMWTNAQPTEWLAAHFIKAVADWTTFHGERFEFGFGPSYGSIQNRMISQVENIYGTMEFDLARAIDLFVEQPLHGRDLELFARVLEVQELIADKDQGARCAPVDGPDATLERRRREIATRTPAFNTFEAWVNEAAETQYEYFIERLQQLAALAALSTDAAQTTKKWTTDDVLVLLAQPEPTATPELTFSSSGGVVIGAAVTREFSVLSTPAPRPTGFQLGVGDARGTPSPNTQLLLELEQGITKPLFQELEGLSRGIEGLVEEIRARGLWSQFYASSADDRRDWRRRGLMAETMQALRYEELSPREIGPLQYLAVAWYSELTLDDTLGVLPLTPASVAVPAWPEATDTDTVLAFIASLHEVKTECIRRRDVSFIQASALAEPGERPAFGELERSWREGEQYLNAWYGALAPADRDDFVKRARDYFGDRSKTKRALADVIADFNAVEGMLAMTDALTTEQLIANIDRLAVSVPVREQPLFREPLQLRVNLLAQSHLYERLFSVSEIGESAGAQSPAEVDPLFEGTGLVPTGESLRNIFLDSIEQAMIHWAATALTAINQGEARPEYPYFYEGELGDRFWKHLEVTASDALTLRTTLD